MRIITGDECGLLKESIPELSRSKESQPPPAVGTGVTRLGAESGELNMSRTKGVIGLSFCEINSSGDDVGTGSLSFCALRADGSFEKWGGFSPYNSKEDRICGGTYKKSHTLEDIFDLKENKEKDEFVGRPISMKSAHSNQVLSTESRPDNIVACCTSMGFVSVVNTNAIDKGVVARYSAYSTGNRIKASKISYTRGEFVNRDIATGLAMSLDSEKIVVGGRERAATMLDVETGKSIWKAKKFATKSTNSFATTYMVYSYRILVKNRYVTNQRFNRFIGYWDSL